jgi:hypothetical protein
MLLAGAKGSTRLTGLQLNSADTQQAMQLGAQRQQMTLGAAISACTAPGA